jgi:hypothetical protein
MLRGLELELTSPKTWLISGEVMKSPLRPKTSCLISAKIFDCAWSAIDVDAGVEDLDVDVDEVGVDGDDDVEGGADVVVGEPGARPAISAPNPASSART